ncbi:T9SS type A sorting domain-containing protein [Sphingobacteriales bacterium CHB3]|nr:T9SS type A sorting domain-containing protein [Sphingobacteriales bacterium CHB3]
MDQSITRKEFLRNGTKVAAGAALGVGTLHMLTGSPAHADKMVTPWPWPYQALDVEAARIAGHDAYWEGKGCSYGAFHAIASQLRTVLPDPWNQLPSEIMIYGHGGGAGWGATCGALNGPAALISLVLLKARSDVLISDMYGWYTQTLFPTDISNQYAVNHVFHDNRCDIILPQNAAGSPLCHPSVTEWCKVANYTSDALQRKERCARITGDVAAFAAQILNEERGGTFVPRYVAPSIIGVCMSCHGAGLTNRVAAKMECTQCHGTNPHQTAVQHVGDPAPTYKLGQNYPNPFNPATNIEFSIPEAGAVTLAVYDVHGRLVKNIIANETYSSGTFKAQWDGTNDAGMRAASGIYFARLTAGTFSAVQKMNLVK